MARTGEVSAAQGLDLSFVQLDNAKETVTPKKVRQSDVLDLGFMRGGSKQSEFDPLEAKTEPVKVIPIAQEREKGFLKSVANLFTGDDRKTETSEKLPEFDLPPSFIFKRPGDSFKAALGLLVNFDTEDQAKILKRNFPELKFSRDEKDNVIVDATELGGGQGVLNKPGISGLDVRQTAFLMGAFTPAAKVAKAGSGVAANATRVGAAAGGTQIALDVAGQAAGRTEKVSASNIKGADVAITTIGAGGFQSLFQVLAKSLPVLRQKFNQLGVTDEIRDVVKKTAIRLGMKADDITDDVIEGILKQTKASTDIKTAVASQGEREFGIPLTKGQRSLDQPQLSFEDRARAGIQGEKAQRVMLGFEKEQQLPAIQTAQASIQSKIGKETIETVSQAGGVVGEGIKKAERVAKEQVDEAFSLIKDAALKPGVFQKLITWTKNTISGDEFIKDQNLAPATNALLQKLNTLEKTLGVSQKGEKEILQPVHIKKVEEIRKAINAFEKASANPTDRRNILVMKRAYDDFLDNAVKHALFNGDDKALEALKNSRSMFREYALKFRENVQRTKGGNFIPDAEGKFIEKIIADNPTDVEVVNALFGSGNFNKASGARMAERFKNIIGGDSPEWGAVKQAAFKKLVKTTKVNGTDVISGSQTLNAIDDSVSKNPELMNQVFSKEEVGMIRRFALQVKRTQPDLVRSRENPSGTAQVAVKSIADFAKRVSAIFGASGEPALFVTSKGVEISRGLTSGAKAKAAVRPFEVILNRPELVSGTLAVTQPKSLD